MSTMCATRPGGAKRRAHGGRILATILPFLLLLVLGVGVSGCADQSRSSEQLGHERAEGRVTAQEPVSAPGVDSCRLVSRLQRADAEPADDALDPIQLPCLTDGPSVELSVLGGKPVLVNPWASWCGPCRKEMPLLQAASSRHGDRVQFVGVDVRDDPHAAAAFLREVGVTYPQLADPHADLSKQLRIPGIPVTLILGRDGGVVDKHIGALDEESLDDLLDEALTEDAP